MNAGTDDLRLPRDEDWARFEAAVATLPLPDRPVAAWDEMRRRAEAGEFLPVDRYLDAAGLSDPGPGRQSLRTDIVYGDMTIRRESGRRIDVDTYLARFPDLAESLGRQLSFEHAVAEATQANPSASPHGPETPLPVAVGRYRIIDRIGSGGQGEVYRAVHPTLGCDVALKVSRHAVAADDRDRLLEEGRILAELSHPGLPRVFDVELLDGRPVVVLEYVRGLPLDRAGLNPGPKGRNAATLVLKLTDAVAATHRRGIAHLDLKPKNVLLDESGEPRLLDFGLARWFRPWDEADGHMVGVSGTLQYMAPEQARGEADRVGPAADVYGLGGVLFYLLCGRPPRPAGTAAELLDRARRGEIDRGAIESAAIPTELKEVCLKALAADPAERYGTVAEFAAALAPFAVVRGATKAAVSLSGALMLVVAAVTAALIANRPAPPGVPESRTSTRETASAGAMPAMPVALDVRVWPRERPGDGPFDLVDVSPVRVGDEIAVTLAAVPEGDYAALFSVAASGKIEKLATLGPDDPDREIRFPEKRGTAAPLAGEPGPELLLAVSGRGAPPDPARFWSPTDADAWRSLGFRSVYRLTPDGVEAEQEARSFGPPVERRDPEGDAERFLASLGRRLEGASDSFAAIAFPLAAAESSAE